MKKNLLLAIVICSMALCSINAQSNLFMDQSYTVEEMVMDFFNHPDITVSNVSYTGDDTAYAFFDAGGTMLDVDAGLFFCTGSPEIAVGPNTLESGTGINSGGSDPDLEQTSGMIGNDAFIIEFDFTISDTDSLYFKYAFGSEEYCEFVNSGFNDVFGFFVSGPGINGPYSNNSINIAVVGNSQDLVNINSINHLQNTNLFHGNSDTCDPILIDYDNLYTNKTISK